MKDFERPFNRRQWMGLGLAGGLSSLNVMAQGLPRNSARGHLPECALLPRQMEFGLLLADSVSLD